MESKNTYNPEDIESLLMHKKFDELLTEEKVFVMKHIDSKEEYNLMRTTLLAIKKSADNNESIVANPKVKEDLLMLLESKSTRFGWFNLNGILAFLFPKDVIVFKKPGFQLASFAMLLVFGFYLSAKMIDFTPDNLAVNTTTKKENNEISPNINIDSSSEITETIIEEEQIENKEVTQKSKALVEQPKHIAQTIKEAEEQPRVKSVPNVSFNQMDQAAAGNIYDEKLIVNDELAKNSYLDADDAVLEEVMVENNNKKSKDAPVPSSAKIAIAEENDLGVKDESYIVKENRVVNINNESKSLGNNDKIIGLLFVTL